LAGRRLQRFVGRVEQHVDRRMSPSGSRCAGRRTSVRDSLSVLKTAVIFAVSSARNGKPPLAEAVVAIEPSVPCGGSR
jgi:hypothetical protein